jgi:hypothetical protein
MSQGDKSSHAEGTQRQAQSIETGCDKKGFRTPTAAGRAWAAVNKITGGGKKSGSGSSKRGWLFIRFPRKPAVFTLTFGHVR